MTTPLLPSVTDTSENLSESRQLNVLMLLVFNTYVFFCSVVEVLFFYVLSSSPGSFLFVADHCPLCCPLIVFFRWVIYNDQKVCASEKPPKDLGYIYFYQRVQS